MKVKFETNEVFPKLLQVASVINAKNSMAILSDVCFNVGTENIIMTASDGENWVTERAEVLSSDMEATFCVPAKDISNCLKTLSDENVTMTLDEEAKTVTLDYGDGRISLPYESSNEFPKPNLSVEDASEVILSGSLFKKAVRLARESTENSIVMPVMSGVHFTFSGSEMIVNGASHARVMKFVESLSAWQKSQYDNFTLPPKASSVILSVLEGVEEDVKLRFTDKAASVSNRNFKITARLLEGNYPDCERVIPTNNSIVIEVEKERMIQALRRVLSIENSNSLVTLYINKETITVSAEDASYGRTSEETVRCVNETDGEIEICFNGEVVSDAMKSIEDENVVISMSAPSRPALIHAKTQEQSEKYLSVIMPMVINNKVSQ